MEMIIKSLKKRVSGIEKSFTAHLDSLLIGGQTLLDYRFSDPDRQAAMRGVLQLRELNWDE